MGFTIDTGVQRTQQENAITTSNSLFLSVSKQPERDKVFYRLLNFHQQTMDVIGANLPKLLVLKYMFDSATERRDDGSAAKVVITSRKVLMEEDPFESFVMENIQRMKEEEDEEAIALHNSLFLGKYNKRYTENGGILVPNNFGIKEVWVPVLPILESEDGVSVAGEPKILNIKTSGANALFGQVKGGNFVDGLIHDYGDMLVSQEGHDFYVQKTGSEYSVGVRPKATTIEGYDDYVNDPDKLPNPVAIIRETANTEKGIEEYKAHMGIE